MLHDLQLLNVNSSNSEWVDERTIVPVKVAGYYHISI